LTVRAAGIEATILERLRFPRCRPGETLHPGIEPLLGRLGVLPSILAAGYVRHTGHWVEWVGPGRFVPFGADARGPWRGFQAPRDDFDQRLLAAAARKDTEIAADAGVRVRTVNGRVRGVDTSTGGITADFTIDCTGTSRWLSRQLGISMRRCSPPLLARFGYARGNVADRAALPRIQADHAGWTWTAEVEPGRFHWTRVTRPIDRPDDGWLPARLKGCTAESPRGADVTWRIARRTAGLGWFLAGDAAALLDPSSSHGVLRAIMTGMMAGHLAVQSLRGRAGEADCARAYHEWLSAWFRSDSGHMSALYRKARLFGFDRRWAVPAVSPAASLARIGLAEPRA
jgi:flavin-dependent dehydrogenase